MKLSRKWVLLAALVLSVAMATSGTLAYLTDTDADVNVMTVGRVDIVQNEQQRVEKDGVFTAELEAFKQEKMLLPYTSRTNTPDTVYYGEKSIELNDLYNNYIDKIVTVTNKGNTPAYVRTLIALPTGGEVWEDNKNPAENWLHWNLDGESASATEKSGKEWWLTNGGNAIAYFEYEGIRYEAYELVHEAALQPKETSLPSMVGLFMDKRVDYGKNGYFMGETAIEDFLGENGMVDVLVLTQAVQADGFASAKGALDEAFPMGDNNVNVASWFSAEALEIESAGDANDPPVFPEVTVSSTEELAKAIADGKKVIELVGGNEYNFTSVAKGKTFTVVGPKTAVINVIPAGQGEAGGQLDYSLDGSTVTFEGVTIKTNSKTYAGFARLSGTYNNCVIQNTYNLGVGNSEFNGCTFNITNEYLRVGGAYNASFNGCTFNTDGRAILVFQDGTSVAQTVTVKDCTFNATAAANTWNGIHVAAVSIDGSQGGTYTVNLEGNNTVDSDFNGLWQIKAGEANVTVNE